MSYHGNEKNKLWIMKERFGPYRLTSIRDANKKCRPIYDEN